MKSWNPLDEDLIRQRLDGITSLPQLKDLMLEWRKDVQRTTFISYVRICSDICLPFEEILRVQSLEQARALVILKVRGALTAIQKRVEESLDQLAGE